MDSLEQVNLELQQKLSAMLAEQKVLETTIKVQDATILTQNHYIAQLRQGLEFYLPGDFWETVVQDTKADQDRGKHAAWVLRMTAGSSDPAGA